MASERNTWLTICCAPLVRASGPVRNVHVLAHVPLQVRGTVRFDGVPPQRIDAVVGGKPLRLEGSGELEALALSVSVPDPASVLTPPGARRWLDLASAGRLPPGFNVVGTHTGSSMPREGEAPKWRH